MQERLYSRPADARPGDSRRPVTSRRCTVTFRAVLSPATSKIMPGKPWTLLNYAFRPFFLFGGLYAVLALVLWIAALHGAGWSPAVADPVLWHAHEMLFGFALGAIAGFLLTAVSTWTGRPQICGAWLGALTASWITGRLAMLAGSAWPDGLIVVADMLFPLLFAGLAAREILGGRSRRNYGIAAIAVAFAGVNLGYHLGRVGFWPAADRVAVLLAAHLVLLLITVIAGRIVPSFTANWLRMRGELALPVVRPMLDRVLLALMIAVGFTDSLLIVGAPAMLAAILCLATAVLHAVRLGGWRGTAAKAEPLLAVLHVAYAWLPLGYLLLGLSSLGLPVPRSAALHALTMGGVGTMILAVATRVALGHTGRALAAAPLTVAAYVILNAAVLVRILSPFAPGVYLVLIDVAAGGWMAAFALFLWVYWPVLTRPRIDGRPERRPARS